MHKYMTYKTTMLPIIQQLLPRAN